MTPTPLTAMTFNLGAGLAEPARLVAALRAASADLVGLQEVAPAQAAAIEAALADLYPYRVIHPLGIPGKGLLSRFPLAGEELLELFSGRPDLRATVAAPGGPLAVLVGHPPPPRFGRRWPENAAAATQLAALAAAAAGGGPALLLADVNRAPWQAAARRLAAAGLVDAFAAAGQGRGATTPTRLTASGPVGRLALPPLLRVDYVWHTPHFRAVAAWLGDAAGSDHRPVLARLERIDGAEEGR